LEKDEKERRVTFTEVDGSVCVVSWKGRRKKTEERWYMAVENAKNGKVERCVKRGRTRARLVADTRGNEEKNKRDGGGLFTYPDGKTCKGYVKKNTENKQIKRETKQIKQAKHKQQTQQSPQEKHRKQANKTHRANKEKEVKKIR
jgi:hypothetical protein